MFLGLWQGCAHAQEKREKTPISYIWLILRPCVSPSAKGWNIGSKHLDISAQSLVGSVVRICLSMQETQVYSLGWEDPLEKEMATHSILGSSMDRGAWQATVHGVTTSWTWLNNNNNKLNLYPNTKLTQQRLWRPDRTVKMDFTDLLQKSF